VKRTARALELIPGPLWSFQPGAQLLPGAGFQAFFPCARAWDASAFRGMAPNPGLEPAAEERPRLNPSR
jgi:hypothetical protein